MEHGEYQEIPKGTVSFMVNECIKAISAADLRFAATTYDRNTCKITLEAAIRCIRERFPNA